MSQINQVHSNSTPFFQIFNIFHPYVKENMYLVFITSLWSILLPAGQNNYMVPFSFDYTDNYVTMQIILNLSTCLRLGHGGCTKKKKKEYAVERKLERKELSILNCFIFWSVALVIPIRINIIYSSSSRRTPPQGRINTRIYNVFNYTINITQHTYFIHARKDHQHPCLTIEHVYAFYFRIIYTTSNLWTILWTTHKW
jgi:hypothetical protein